MPVNLGLTMHLFRRPAAAAAFVLMSAAAPSSRASSPTPPAAPAVTATAAAGSVTLSWSAVADAIGYDVYESTTEGQESGNPVIQGSNATSVTLPGLTVGTTYYFEVTALNGAGAGPYSGEVSAVPLLAGPLMQNATVADSSVTLNWSAVGCATSYNLYQGTSAGGEGSIPAQTGIQGTSVTVAKLNDGSPYYFTVRAVCPSALSVPSGEISAIPSATAGGVPIPPLNLAASLNGSSGAVALSWGSVAGAQSYNVYMGTSAGGEAATPVLSGLTGAGTVVSQLTNNTPYYFTVQAVSASGSSAPSNEASAEPVPAGSGLAAPQNVAAAVVSARVTLTWSPSLGATSYTVYQSSSPFGESFTAVQTSLTQTTALITTLIDSDTYYFTVTASDAQGESPQAFNLITVPTLAAPGYPPAAPGTISFVPPPANTGTLVSVTLNWPAVSGATSYSLYQGQSPQNELATPVQTGLVADPASNMVSAVAGDLLVGQTYYFQVTALSPGGQSTPSPELAVPIPPITDTKSGGGGALDAWTLAGLLSLVLLKLADSRRRSIDTEKL